MLHSKAICCNVLLLGYKLGPPLTVLAIVDYYNTAVFVFQTYQKNRKKVVREWCEKALRFLKCGQTL